ncbi:hypothetical protein ASE00_09195 [Sphingomonas sp. Root710]|uniref:trypsin-like peptidase domain-containing protein n=1 Tax=Sphingomonas sp. Root710 TaxID=1736594 RepID=UPI0006F99AB9|nr:trypsin-like peptidase domain-containing protein [Sphingomonas sp. Root710]KRB82254.1 hypothetical protein ASE00_09195 [Sphingomonas sp. Root710]
MSAILVAGMAALAPGGGPAAAMRFGGTESRTAPGAFEAVGRLECPTAGGRARVRDATGWILGAADTAVTAAHSLYADGAAIDPRNCFFSLLNPDGSVRETARVRYVRSPWADARRRSDSAYDVAVLKLDRPMAAERVAAVAVRPSGRAVQLISFPADAADGRARISNGEARPFPYGLAQDGAGGTRVTDPSRLFASSTESASGSSGGMYYAPGAHAAVGLHVGYVCAGNDCFNIGLRFDADILAMIAEVAADSGERMASADRASMRALR